MPIPVPIDALAEELAALPDNTRVWLNRTTGEFLMVPNHDMGVIEEDREEDGFEWEWPDEEIEKLRQIALREEWFALPDQFEIHEWAVMQEFVGSVSEPLASRLDRAIHGRGAFRAFRDELDRAGRTQAWYSFKHEHLVKLVKDVLEEEGVPFRRGRE